MAERFFLDSNIVMCAIGGPHALQKPCAAIIERVQAGRLVTVTDTEVLQEILYRYGATGKSALAIETARLVMEIADEVFSVTPDDLHFTMQLLHGQPTTTVRDAIHCATMVRHRVRSILSADHHFDRFDRIRRIDPKAFADR